QLHLVRTRVRQARRAVEVPVASNGARAHRLAGRRRPRRGQAAAVNLVLLEAGEARSEVTLDGVRGRHLLHVLHVEPGQQVRVGVVDGPCGTATVESLAGETVPLRCVFEADAPPVPAVDLLLALPRPKVMRRLWAQI